MGLNMTLRLLEKGHHVVTYDTAKEAMEKVEQAGAETASSAEELIEKLERPRMIWIMVPHMAVENVIESIRPKLTEGDTIIDGGNSPYTASKERADALSKIGVHFLDVGVSGGPSGAREGACLMIGGKREIYESIKNLFKDIATEGGYGYMGGSGAGHFVKMVHNGIEYGMMQAIAEGFHIMKCSEFDLDLEEVARVYNQKSVIESRLIGWLGQAFKEHGNDLKAISGKAAASGEGEWTVKVAHELGIPDSVIHEALSARASSQLAPNYQGQIVQALRNQFGGHSVK